MSSFPRSASSSRLTSKNYDYDNLPSFGKRHIRGRPGHQFDSNQNNRMLLMGDQPSTSSLKTHQFVPQDNLYANTLAGSAISEAKQRSAFKDCPETFESSTNSKGTLFSKRINGMFKSFTDSIDDTEMGLRNELSGKIAPLKHGNNPDSSNNQQQTEMEFISFLKLLWTALSCLGKKLYAWIIFIVLRLTSLLVVLINKIPTPHINNATTANNNTEDDEPDNLSDVELPSNDIFESTPVKSLNSSKVDVSAKLSTSDGIRQRLFSISNALTTNKVDQSIHDDQAQYGTFFYTKNPSGNNQKSTSEVIASIKSIQCGNDSVFQNTSQQLIDHAADVTNTIQKLFKMRQSDSDNTVSKPLFTRSSARFRDLQWLRDDHTDYLTNLESTKLFKEYKKIMEERLKMQDLEKLKKMKAAAKIVPLTTSQLETVQKLWLEPYSNRMIISKFNIEITTKDLFTLSDRKWLNDSVIDFYMSLINDRAQRDESLPSIHAFSSYFFTTLRDRGYSGVKKWAKRAKVDVTNVDYIFIPINIYQSHWALGRINNKKRSFEYYDSLFGTGTQILDKLEEYMVGETKRLYGESMNGIDYSKYEFNGAMPCPTQQNGFDCGVFTCTMADYLSREVPMLFTQTDMPTLRRRMAYEIANGHLIDH